MKRLFLAIPIPEEIKSIIKKEKDQLNLPLQWIPEINLHVTLHFFGNIEETSIDDLKQYIQRISINTPPFTMRANSILQKSDKFQNMIWVGFEKSFEFENLAIEINRIMGKDKYRKPLPHINLARSKKKISSDNFPLYLKPSLEITITHFELWQSILSPKGSTFVLLESFPLN